MSDRDGKWMQDLMKEILPGKDCTKISWGEFYEGLSASFAMHEDPSKRTLGDSTRGSNGTFDNESSIKLITASTEDCAGNSPSQQKLITAAFNSGVPKILRVVEMLGITQSRNWRTSSLNEYCIFFGLPPHKSFKEINSDPEKAAALLHFYSHPDYLELYPGILLEDNKKTAGWLPSLIVARGLFTDFLGVLRVIVSILRYFHLPQR
jgi:hypothetical protein